MKMKMEDYYRTEKLFLDFFHDFIDYYFALERWDNEGGR